MTKVLNSIKLVPVLFVLDVAVMYASLTLSGLALNVQNVVLSLHLLFSGVSGA